METLLIYIAKSSICLTAIYSLYFVMFRNTTFFTFNRIYLSIGIILSLLLPFIRFKNTVVLPSLNTVSITNITSTEVSQTSSTNYLLYTAIVLFAGGIFVRLSYLLYDIYKIFKLKKTCEVKTIEGINYCINPSIKNPFSFGKNIFIGVDFFSDKERDIIVQHELTHIKQYHIVDLILGQSILLLQWFNPLSWLYVKSQKQNLEYIADKVVISNGVHLAEYQATLLNTLLEHQAFALGQSFNYANPLKRINMMKKEKTNNLRKLSLVLALPLLGGFLWANTSSVYVYNDKPTSDVKIDGKSYKNALFIVDNEVVDFNLIDPSSIETFSKLNGESVIESLNILNGEKAIETYGEKAKGGAVIITSKNAHKKSSYDRRKALIIVDGEKVANIEDLNPSDISKIEILKDELAIDTYGEKGKNGVMIISTKNSTDNTEADQLTGRIGSIKSNEVSPQVEIKGLDVSDKLIIVDGVEIKNLDSIDPKNIKSMSVLKSKSATKFYGEKGKNGVILITMKNSDI